MTIEKQIFCCQELGLKTPETQTKIQHKEKQPLKSIQPSLFEN